MFAHPLISLASMTFWFALVFAVQGISEIVQYFKSEEKHGWNLFEELLPSSSLLPCSQVALLKW